MSLNRATVIRATNGWVIEMDDYQTLIESAWPDVVSALTNALAPPGVYEFHAGLDQVGRAACSVRIEVGKW